VQNLNDLLPTNSGYEIAVTVGINDKGQIIAESGDTTTEPTTTGGQAVLLTPN
jgi:hypothetical protein